MHRKCLNCSLNCSEWFYLDHKILSDYLYAGLNVDGRRCLSSELCYSVLGFFARPSFSTPAAALFKITIQRCACIFLFKPLIDNELKMPGFIGCSSFPMTLSHDTDSLSLCRSPQKTSLSLFLSAYFLDVSSGLCATARFDFMQWALLISRVQRAPDKLVLIREKTREEGRREDSGWREGENDPTGAEIANSQDNREAECLRK